MPYAFSRDRRAVAARTRRLCARPVLRDRRPVGRRARHTRPRPDEAVQALRGDFDYFQVAGSGPTFPVALRAAERFRAWLGEVGMFSQVGYAAYNAALDATRADVAAALGDPGGAARVALAQSATEGLNALVAGMRLPPRSLLLSTAEEHGSALYPLG